MDPPGNQAPAADSGKALAPPAQAPPAASATRCVSPTPEQEVPDKVLVQFEPVNAPILRVRKFKVCVRPALNPGPGTAAWWLQHTLGYTSEQLNTAPMRVQGQKM